MLTLILPVPPAIGQQQPANNAPPDTITLSDGQTLMGHFVGASGGKATFHQDVLGDVTVDWSKIRELHAHGRYAVVNKELELRPGMNLSNVPMGAVDMTNQMVTVNPGGGAAPQTFGVADVAQVTEEAAFRKEVQPASFFQDWKGSVTAGATVVVSTQQSRTYTGAVSLMRVIPADSSLAPRNRTTLNLSASDGSLTQPGSPTLKTEIFHGDAERDQYLSGSKLFYFGQLAFDHNFAQGLRLQQTYGAGLGWTAIKTATESLDFKASMDYIQERFFIASQNQNLVATNFAETFNRTFDHGITLTEQLSVLPAWNNLNAWQAAASTALSIPVYKRLAFTLSLADSFLNNPPPGFRKNSFTLTTGLTYTLP
jgi:hypothetical protein